MQELIQIVVQKTGLTEQQAEAAAVQVLIFLKSRLPGPLHKDLDNALSGSPDSIKIKDAGGKLGDLLSGK